MCKLTTQKYGIPRNRRNRNKKIGYLDLIMGRQT